MAKGGVITRKELATDEAIRWGAEYAKNIQLAIDKNELLKQSALEFQNIAKGLKNTATEKEYLVLKEKEIKLTKLAIQTEKEKNNALLSAQKIKTEAVRTDNLLLDQKRKQNAVTKQSTKLTALERYEISLLNKQAKEAVVISSRLSTAYEKQAVILTQLRRKYKDAALTQGESSKKAKDLRAQIIKLDAALKRVDANVGQFQRSVGNYGKAMNSARGAVRSLAGAMGAVGGAYLFVAVMRDAFKRVREFDKSMQNLAGVFRTTRKDLAPLEADIISIAGSSIKTSREVADLAETLATLGKSKEQISLLLKPVVDLGIGLNTTGGEAGEFLIQMLNAFGASDDEAMKYADTIATIRTSTTLDFQKMRDSFQYIAPISRILNKDLAYTGSVVGILADNSLKAESAGRILATAQQKLAKDGKTLSDALSIINDASERGAKEIELLAIASDLFGKQGAKVGVILAQNSDLIDKNAQAIRDNGGALKDLVDQQLESLDAKLKILDSSWERFILSIEKGDGAISEFFKKSIINATDFIGVLTDINIVTGIIGDRELASDSEGFLYTWYQDAVRARDATKEFQAARKSLETIDVSNINEIQSGLDNWQAMRKEVEGNTEVVKILDFFIAKLRRSETTYYESARDRDDETKKRNSDKISANKKAATESADKAKELTAKQKAARDKRIEQEKTDLFNLNKFRLSEAIKNQDAILASEESSWLEKVRAIQEREDIQVNLAELTQLNLLRGVSEGSDKQILIQEKTSAKLIEIYKKTNSEIDKLGGFGGSIKEVQEDEEIDNDEGLGVAGIEAIKEKIKELAETLGLDGDDMLARFLEANEGTFANLYKLYDGLNEKAEESADLRKDLERDLANSAIDFANTLFYAKVSGIEDEIEANNDKYDNLINLAEGDELKQDLLRQEKEKKEKELEKKKREEQKKAAIFNKVLAVGEIGMKLGVTIASINAAAAAIDVFTPYALGATGLAYRASNLPLAIGSAALNVATVIATPIPKYAKGTNYKPMSGMALVGEERPEVITEPNKNPYIVSKPTLLDLPMGTKVAPSVEEYQQLMRVSQMASLDINYRNANDYQQAKESFNNMDLKELIKETKNNTNVLKKKQLSVRINQKSTDFSHELFSMKNTSWD